MTERFGVPLPDLGDLPALPQGVVLHWTGGTHRANSVDLAAYHYVVEGDGTVKAGRHPVAANMKRLSSGVPYAAHTGGFNSFRIGIAAAGMKDYNGPNDPGPYPLTEVQVARMVDLAAYFCDLGGLDVTDPLHLCTHREVWTIHGVRGTRNHLKRDIEHLPHRPNLHPDNVGPYLRGLAVQVSGRMTIEDVRPGTPIGQLVYSPALRDYLVVTEYRADHDWEFVRLADVRKLTSTVAGTRLSKMPRHP